MTTETKTQPFHCPLCKESDYTEVKTFLDGVVVGKCNSCGLSYTPKRHNTPEDLFGDISMDKIQMMYSPILENKKNHFRNKIFIKYLNKIKKYSSGKNHLDIGCAHGFFIDITKKNGFKVTGVEPNKTMADFGRIYLNLNIINGTLDQVSLTDKWDVITFTDSLEYFKNPIEDLSKLVQHNLNENGIVFIKVPNGDYFYARHILKNKLGLSLGGAEAYSPSKRVAHYNNKTIKILAESLNLEILNIGFFLPIDSPVWHKYLGLHLEIENPWWLGVKERIVRKTLHVFGLIEFFFLRKNHFSQAVYVVARKNKN
jgi:2-polyprenyl-3-methyl-5-hydroxy-6-metoxy-1,4-benzoquinol methylase